MDQLEQLPFQLNYTWQDLPIWPLTLRQVRSLLKITKDYSFHIQRVQ
jgi:hypothetical protein